MPFLTPSTPQSGLSAFYMAPAQARDTYKPGYFFERGFQNRTMDDDVIIEGTASSSPVTPVMSNPGTPRSELDIHGNHGTPPPAIANRGPQLPQMSQHPQTKYTQLLAVIEDMGKDIRPTYSGSKSSAERLKRGIVHARILVRECLMECERSART
ncbi:cyclin-dependent kinase 2-associated protein 2-like isoform X1 [Octopus sinensis]|uniref:Cyclin-dependent kinase 2-associated protein 2-like isoform X1 n=1 Tax=Octopus sinensis TaxID=2607531 RepID=A0A6P7TV89_9MOLL|nr:cyclin-dependent kinase 2-associated protein 2-like isoform X1 [Octopus sinensis]